MHQQTVVTAHKTLHLLQHGLPDSSVLKLTWIWFQVSFPINVQTQTFLPSSVAASSMVVLTSCYRCLLPVRWFLPRNSILWNAELYEWQEPMGQALMWDNTVDSIHSACSVLTDSLRISLVEATATPGLWPQNDWDFKPWYGETCTCFNFNTQNNVIVSYHWCNKVPPTQWLKTIQIYFLTVLDVRSLALVSLG